MWICIGLGIAAVCFIFFWKKSSKETLKRVPTKEFLWKIKKVSEKMKNKDVSTMDFTFGSRKWSLVLEWKDDNVALTAKCKNRIMFGRVQTIFLGVGIEQYKDQTLSHWYEFQMTPLLSEQNSNTGRKEPRKGYLPMNKDLMLPEDALTLFVRISTYPSPFCVITENHKGPDTHYSDVAEDNKSMHKASQVVGDDRLCQNCKVLNNLSNNLKDLYLENKDPDVRIIVGNENLRAHRTILKARSPVMASMLKQETSEIREDDYDSKDFAIFIGFLYSGTTDNLTTDNVISVYNIAEKYEVPDLMETCAEYMVSKLTVNSVSNVISVALKHKDCKLQKYATDFFLKHAEKIFPTTEWQTFLIENPTTANELVIKSYSFKNS